MEAFSPLMIFWQKYLPEKKATQRENQRAVILTEIKIKDDR